MLHAHEFQGEQDKHVKNNFRIDTKHANADVIRVITRNVDDNLKQLVIYNYVTTNNLSHQFELTVMTQRWQLVRYKRFGTHYCHCCYLH